jgi:hypothetical protein
MTASGFRVAETAGFAQAFGVSALLLVIAALVARVLLPARIRTVRDEPAMAAPALSN